MNIERTPIGEMYGVPTTWMLPDAVEAMGLHDCGCGIPPEHRLTCFNQSCIEFRFVHEDSCCMMAFIRNTWQPLSYEKYKDLFSEYEEY